MTSLTGRLLFQKCDKVILRNLTASGDLVNMVSINKGMIVYVSFLKGATAKTVDNMVKNICSVNLFNDENNGEKLDLTSLPGDLLLVPHFCLGGKLRGKSFQYHGIADKECAETLFTSLCESCKIRLSTSEKWKLGQCKVERGSYGFRQDIEAIMNGPMSHIVDYND